MAYRLHSKARQSNYAHIDIILGGVDLVRTLVNGNFALPLSPKCDVVITCYSILLGMDFCNQIVGQVPNPCPWCVYVNESKSPMDAF